MQYRIDLTLEATTEHDHPEYDPADDPAFTGTEVTEGLLARLEGEEGFYVGPNTYPMGVTVRQIMVATAPSSSARAYLQALVDADGTADEVTAREVAALLTYEG